MMILFDDTRNFFTPTDTPGKWWDIRTRKMSMTTNVANHLNKENNPNIPHVTLWKDVGGNLNPYSEDSYVFRFEITERKATAVMSMAFYDEKMVMGRLGGKVRKGTLKAYFPTDMFLDVVMPFMLTKDFYTGMIGVTLGAMHKEFLVEYILDLCKYYKEIRG